MIYMNAKDCFEVLRISGDATLEEAKESYRRLVKLWHPDQYANFPEKQKIAQEKLTEINVAYRDIVSKYKNRPLEAGASSVGEDIAPKHEKAFSEGQNTVAALWNRVSRFVHSNLLKSKHTESRKKDVPLSPGAERRHGPAFTGGNCGPAPDFQQVLKRAVGKRQLRGEGWQRNRSRRGVRRQFGNAASYRGPAAVRRSPGDRVEKISPAGRVNRIGGD